MSEHLYLDHPAVVDDRQWSLGRSTWSLETIVHCTKDGVYSLEIKTADPQIGISGELLEAIAEGRSPFARLTPSEAGPPKLDKELVSHRTIYWWDARGWPAWGPIGAILRIEASNQTVIYRITKYRMEPDYFVAEWPD